MSENARVPAIYSIGYGHRPIEEFVALLKEHGIEFLGDVRSRPYSRFNPDFSRENIEGVLAAHGIRYVFLGDTLGGDPETVDVRRNQSEERASYAVDYNLVRQQPAFRQGMQRLHKAWDQRVPLALMCSESRPEGCHRVRMIGVQLEEDGIPVLHIDETGTPRTQQDIMLRIDKGQTALPGFGPSGKAATSSRRWKPRAESSSND
jgi:uncharacterized protein (DUF488 family)